MGLDDGDTDGLLLGLDDGDRLGDTDGTSVGDELGKPEGDSVGLPDVYEREREITTIRIHHGVRVDQQNKYRYPRYTTYHI